MRFNWCSNTYNYCLVVWGVLILYLLFGVVVLGQVWLLVVFVFMFMVRA